MSRYKYSLLLLVLLAPVRLFAIQDSMIHVIDEFVRDRMKSGDIPGLSIVVIKDGRQILERGYGYANLENGTKVTEHTCFEIGSNSKAFTALGILLLEQKGVIGLDDPVRKYLPWLNIKSKDDLSPDITINQLLHHTSGVPFSSIDLIHPGNSSEALEQTVRRLTAIRLDNMPGEKFQYATINYDVLGLIIQQVSHQSYEDFIRKNILLPLGMSQTVLFREGADLATGYKFSFLSRSAFNAPFYRGNTPAGYIISNVRDMGRWLEIQISGVADSAYNAAVSASHDADYSVKSQTDGAAYAAGWFNYQDEGGRLMHGGNNPNYSSFILFSRKKKDGVVVLANINSAHTEGIARGVLSILNGKTPDNKPTDLYKSLDIISFTITVMSLVFVAINCYFFITFFKDLFTKIRRVEWPAKVASGLILPVLLLATLAYSLYLIPYALFDHLSWGFIKVWGPFSFQPSMMMLLGSLVFFFLYYLCISVYRKKEERSLYPVIVLSWISGLGNTLIIFTVNEAIGRKDAIFSGFILYFFLGMFLYIYSQRQLRTRLIFIVHFMIFSVRMNLIRGILGTPYHKVEKMERENVLVVLNNDTEEVSNFPHVLTGMITGIITLTCCLLYLGFVNIWGLVVSVVTILCAVSIYYYVSSSAGKVWEQTRDMKNIYIRFIYALMYGLKELKLNKKKSDDFVTDVEQNSHVYKNKSIEGGLQLANVFVIGELIFTIVIGVVVFIFPLSLIGLEEDKVRTFVFVFLYMTGPVNIVLDAFPQLTKIRISWKRIGALEKEIAALSGTVPHTVVKDLLPLKEIALTDVKYFYKNEEDGSSFSIGPVNYTFRTGEIVFVTGGNGSGKSTLSRIICGLYVPDEGGISVNGQAVDSDGLSQLYTTVFSDYYLFDKLYGVDYSSKEDLIEEKLKALELENKTALKDGRFTTTELSTGQRKRLALMVSYLEDKSVYLFDEWAADQDPGFKRFFYEELLQELKEQNKMVIVISHDDRYFHLADRVIRMESGQIVQAEHYAL